ncbi:cardiolipin synthase [Aestuariirhabdus litorea]|uniref:Cardiolipin synthase A n=1 Tax=Aestuariirhabdus litorea TaxID=2528527 RepID=A0A3P3VID5_9GAMM|nr:cardiolipin synthase [Aestuariirhabdus litorea]RRJ82501.1 cardiolipin synthase [Aestuariirhabdus litorea]RWW92662.1 cardiolipin synthase [Endozoicomonadaceae bacterium GTF-13]
MDTDLTLYSSAAALAYLLVSLALALRIVMRRRPVGVSLAWLLLLFLLPVVGIALYLLIGEHRLGSKRLKRSEHLLPAYSRWAEQMSDSHQDLLPSIDPCYRGVYRLSQNSLGIPALCNNRLELLNDSLSILASIVEDIRHARHFCHLQFYIWSEGGEADSIAEALIEARTRGVECRILLDSVGSAPFLRSHWPNRLRAHGVEVRATLPVGAMRLVLERLDIRNHRKVVVIDDCIGYTGSMNLVDPRHFKQEEGVGEWVDAMARLHGPAVHALNAVFLWDWHIETGQTVDVFLEYSHLQLPEKGGVDSGLQVVPSGPDDTRELIHQLLLAALYSAQEQLVITTPYFVPDEALLTALKSAAARGVQVQLILPRRVDSRLVRYASRSYFYELLNAGIEIWEFDGGLLHTKSVLVDRQIAIFGTVNLDMRSVWLNFEVSLIAFDPQFGESLAYLQQGYRAQSCRIALEEWKRRPLIRRLTENLAQLLSPLL